MALPTRILKSLIDLNKVHIEKIVDDMFPVTKYGETIYQYQIDVHVRPYKRDQCRCPICKQKCPADGYKQKTESVWRAPNLNGVPVRILYRPHRIKCPEHGEINEYLPWTDGKSRFTARFNDEVTWMVGKLPKSSIADYYDINYRTVGNCVQATLDRLEPDLSERIHNNLTRISIDETSVKKGYKYITVVVNMDNGDVVWVHENHGKSVYEEFCELLSPEERAKIVVVAGDGAKWIDTVTKEYFPNAIRCVDPFHVVEWTCKALDDVRVSTWRKAQREYKRTLEDLKRQELEEYEAKEEARKAYQDAKSELDSMPKRGRPSQRKIELMSFVAAYEEKATPEELEGKRRVGRPKRTHLTPEHEAILAEYEEKVTECKGLRFALLHNPENATANQMDKLALIENSYPELYKAYQLKEALRMIIHASDANLADHELKEWIKEARESGLNPFRELADKIERNMEGILNSIKNSESSAISEATNAKIKKLIRIAHGFRNMENLKALIYLRCSSIVVPLYNRLVPSAKYQQHRRERARILRKAREARKVQEYYNSIG